MTCRLTIAAFVALLLLPACAADEVSGSKSVTTWGAPVAAETEALELGALLDRAAELDGQVLTVRGNVVEVCQSKGCWMMLSDGTRSMRVRFVDYAFFVPKDLTGEIVAEGSFAIELVSVDDARHYLEDAGKHDEAAAITEPQRSFTFLASGVRRAD